jgi:hypothetical protein
MQQSERVAPNRRARVSLIATALICTAGLLPGCGGASSTAASTAEARFVSFYNARCREEKGDRATSHENIQKTEAATLLALTSAARKAPRVATYIADLRARRTLRAEISHAAKLSNVANPISLIEDSYRLATKIYADKKALGLTPCLGPPPRKPIGG